MNPQLQNTVTLRDIHLPDAVSWWPPAIGWWIVAAVIIIAVITLPRLYRYLTFTPLHKVTRSAFDKISNDYQQHQDVSKLIQAISKLLRQISMTYHGREKVAHLTGEKWIDSLNELTTENFFTNKLKSILLYAPYQKNITVDANVLLDTTQNWINALPPPNRSKKIRSRENKSHKQLQGLET